MSSLYGVPPNRSSFSRPLGFLKDISSPVPIAPFFPFRKTSAREVEGRRPFSSSRLECLATTCRLPRVMSSLCLDGAADGRGSDLAALALLGGISLRRRESQLLRQPRTGSPIMIAPPSWQVVGRRRRYHQMCSPRLSFSLSRPCQPG